MAVSRQGHTPVPQPVTVINLDVGTKLGVSRFRHMPGYRRSARRVFVANSPSTRSLRVLVIGAGVSGISVARGLLRDGHDVTVFDQRPDVQAGGGAVTIWSNGATVLGQLGVDMDGAGQLLSAVHSYNSSGGQSM